MNEIINKVVMDAPMEVCSIRLVGAPYVDEFHDLNKSLDIISQNSGYLTDLPKRLAKNAPDLTLLSSPGFFQGIDRKIKSGLDVSYSEAFSSTAFVCAALNLPLKQAFNEAGYQFPETETHKLQSAALLSNFSTKEALKGLSSEEIAGLVSAVLELDTVVRLPLQDSVLCFGGMGGDRGYSHVGQESKLFSLSTLAAFTSALSGLTHKHHSYPNTSKVAGQTTMEKFGARSDFVSIPDMQEIADTTSLIMTSCHNTRSIHSLSHALRGETINHLIGPLAYTIDKDTPVQPFIGVNEKVHPETLIDAILLMHEKGVQKYDKGVVFCGLSVPAEDVSEAMVSKLTLAGQYYQHSDARSLVCLDEVAPPPYGTLAGFFKESSYQGTYIIAANDFYSDEDLACIDMRALLIPNNHDAIMTANHDALAGTDESKMRYLAMTIGLANFVRLSLDDSKALNSETKTVNREMLRERTYEAYQALKTGRAYEKMKQYCAATNAVPNSLNLQIR